MKNENVRILAAQNNQENFDAKIMLTEDSKHGFFRMKLIQKENGIYPATFKGTKPITKNPQYDFPKMRGGGVKGRLELF